MKAQFWSIDAVFAIIVFSAAIIILSTVWMRINAEFAVTYGFGVGSMQTQLQGLQQKLSYPGSPSNWNSFITVNSLATWANVNIGLGSGNNSQLSSSKILELMAMSNANYQATKQLLGVGYDYYITISVPSQYNISMGLNPFSRNATSIQTATLPITIDNGAVGTMRIDVWTNTTFGVS